MKIEDRYRGISDHRLAFNPLEQRFAENWQELCKRGQLEYMLSSRVNERMPVEDKDQKVANTIIQWLGTPVGQAFLEDVLFSEEDEFLQRILTNKEIVSKLRKYIK